MEEEEDKLLLSSLGVTSGVAEDIEKDILKQVEDNSKCNGKNSDNGIHPCERSKDPTSSIGNKLYNRLHALEFEIDAVAASINYTNDAKGIQDCDSDAFTNKEGHTNKNATNAVQVTPDGLTIQQALASERLRSLKRTRDQLQSEIEKFDAGTSTDELLGEVVEEETKHKHKPPNQVQHPGRKLKKRTIAFNEDADFDALLDAASTGFVETERDALVRKGVLTPFHSLKGFERRIQQAGSSNILDFPEEETNETFASASIAKVAQAMSDIAESRSTTKLLDAKSLPKLDGPTHYFQKLKTPLKHALPPTSEHEKDKIKKSKRPLPDRKWRKIVENEDLLQTRADEDERKDSDLDSEADEHEEVEDSDDSGSSCIVLEGGLKIPEVIFTRLFDYQKVGVQWLWELHCQKAGGIIGDEMGLGKTIQVISFLGALHYSKMYRPSIVVCPVTLLRQWQREAKKWYPKFHVEILHESAHGSFRPAQKRGSDSDYESEEGSSENERLQPAKSNRWDNLISAVLKSKSGLLVTTYEQLRILGKKLLDVEWGYAILDEGHRIRNPNADITLICKQMQTVHRIIMTGAPLQNKLAELWSLFDFIFPGKLGVLPVFEMEFAVPITVGGYANATPLQVSTAYRCAVVLRDLIMPYLLRRMKADVDAQLPKKTEHVLFCSLTSDQRALYRAFLASSEVEQIFDGNRNSLYGIDIMRKICNHPDLLEREHAAKHPDYGNPDRCGKMKVVAQVLQQWKEQGHRALVFTQTQQMLDILESFLTSCGYIYRRMDGLTPVKQRMALIDEFNNCAEVFVFILTTKVGGLGTNLIGANRVIIYDPDWNPSTDMQARERAWRIGQTRDVTVYRLITRGTIEEKIYHRQIYKHFLTNKVLKNPQQKRFFKARDMKDLFTLQDEEGQNSTETSNIFSQLIGDVNIGIHGDGDSKKASYIASASTSNDVNAANHCDPPTESSVMKSKVKSNKGICEQDEETSILRSLFYANGIHSVVNHDVIMNANDNDRIRMEEQASLVAQKAAEALRQSRMLRSQESFSVPTWTGKSGTAGAPSSARRRFGSTVNSSLISNLKHSSEGSSRPGFQVGVSTGRALSSAELLARTRGNREKAACDGLEHQLGSSSSSCQATSATSRSRSSNRSMIVQPEVLIRQLCTFIQQRGGSADSGSIVQHFKDRISTKDHPIFRSLLKEIALLEKDAEGCRSKWVLKSEYQE